MQQTNRFLAQAYERRLQQATAETVALTAKVLEQGAQLEAAANRIAELTDRVSELESRDSEGSEDDSQDD